MKQQINRRSFCLDRLDNTTFLSKNTSYLTLLFRISDNWFVNFNDDDAIIDKNLNGM